MTKTYEREFVWKDGLYDDIIDSCRNVSGLFKATETTVRREIMFYLEEFENENRLFPVVNEYGIDPARPYDGLFLRTGKSFKYTINYTKKICYSFEDTLIRSQQRAVLEKYDPLPILMGFGRELSPGPWLGDIVGVSNDIVDGIEVLREILIDW